MWGNSVRQRHGWLSLTMSFLAATVGIGGLGIHPASALSCPDLSFPNYPNGDGPEFTTQFGVPFTVPTASGLLAGVQGKAPVRLEISSGTASQNPDPSDDTSFGNATLTYNADRLGGFTYTPDTDPTDPFTGDDTFDFFVIDACGGVNDELVTATVHVLPTVVDASYATGYNTPLSVPVETGFLANDKGVLSDPTDPTSAMATYDTTNTHGTVDDFGMGDGSFTYTPPDGFTGIDTFTYSVWDIDFDNQYTATVSILVGTGPPTAVNAQGGYTADGVHELAQDQAVTVKWTPVASPPTPIDSYTVTASPGGQTVTVPAPANYAVLTGLNDGTPYTFSVHSTDVHGNGPESSPSNAVVPDDGAPPVVAMSTPTASVTLSTHVPAAWHGTDASGVAHYDTRRMSVPWNAASSPWSNWLSATHAAAATYGSTTGRTDCFDARATDNAGHTSQFTATRCTVVPLLSNQLAYSSGWSKVSNASLFGGFAYQSKTHGNTMTRTGVVAKRISLVLTRCASCGTIEVRWNGAVVKTYNLSNRTTLHEQVVAVASFSGAKHGTLTVTVTSGTEKSCRSRVSPSSTVDAHRSTNVYATSECSPRSRPLSSSSASTRMPPGMSLCSTHTSASVTVNEYTSVATTATT